MQTKPVLQSLFGVAGTSRSRLQIVLWWEKRRLIYNAVLLLTLIISGLLITLFDSLPPKPAELLDYEAFSAIILIFLANFFYTFGWIVDLASSLFAGHDSPTLGPRLLKIGLVFSVIVAVLPAAGRLMAWFLRLSQG